MKSRNGADFLGLEINRKILDDEGIENPKFNCLDRFTETIKQKLNDRGWYNRVAFTPHDFDRHIMNVLKNASKLLNKWLHEFSVDELLAIQYACILHDVDMVYNPYQREIHGENGALILDPFSSEQITEAQQKLLGASYQQLADLDTAGQVPDEDIEKTINDVHSVLSQVIRFLMGSDEEMSKAVSRIILGHSDIKRFTNHPINTLDKEFYRDLDLPLGHQQHQMKIRVLASILRLADELDCSKLRKRGIDSDLTVLPPDAHMYWNRLNIISSVDIDVPSIKLVIDTTFFQRDKTRNFDYLMSVEAKIESERTLVQKCFEEESFPLHISEVIIDWGRLGDSFAHEYSEHKKARIDQKKNKNSLMQRKYEKNGLVKSIRTTIEEKNLFREVHRRISGRCVRNQLDCNGLLMKHQILDGIAQVFLNALYTGVFENAPEFCSTDEFALVGVANSGALVAAHMSFVSGLPMVYVIPPDKESKATLPEKELKRYAATLKSKKVALIIGVNHTGSAIMAASNAIDAINGMITEQEQKVTLHCILGIINRDEECEVLQKFENVGIRNNFLVTDYLIEWCVYKQGNKKCPYGSKCKAGEED